MRDSPFFRSRWNQTSRPSQSPTTLRAIPVVRNQWSSPSPKSAPKVVSIPVHFVGSDQKRSSAATMIQKVFRGFLVRKSLKRILAARREVDEVDRRISVDGAYVELIRKDPKERLKVNEALMALLFQLDSVGGVDSGVRDCRKAVIKKTIALQEKVDAIVAGGGGDDENLSAVEGPESNDHIGGDSSDGIAESSDQTLEMTNSMESSATCENQTLGAQGGGDPSIVQCDANDCNSLSDNRIDDGTTEFLQGSLEAMPDPCSNSQRLVDTSPNSHESEIIHDNGMKEKHNPQVLFEDPMEFPHEELEKTIPVVSRVEKHDQPPSSPPVIAEGGGEIISESETQEDREGTLQHGREEEEERFKGCVGARDNKEELMERMVMENGKLMSLVTNLCERNDVQTRLLSTLSHRVEQLERAFMCDKLRRKKKKQRRSTGTVDGPRS